MFALVLLLVRHGQLTVSTAAAACLAVLLLSNRSQQAATSLAQTTEHSRYVEDFMALRAWGERLPDPAGVDVAPRP